MKRTTDRNDSLEKVIYALKNYKVVIIQGLRRIGKSIVMESVANEDFLADYQQLNLDAMMFGQKNTDVMHSFLKRVQENPDNKYLIKIDEFQVLKDWNTFFFTLHGLNNVKVIATGSVSANIANVKETEGGRFSYIEMEPLSFNEYKKIYSSFKGVGQNDEEIFNDFATFGSYPEQEFTGDLTRYKKQISDNIIEKIKNTTLLKSAGISQPQTINNLLMYLIENIGSLSCSHSISQKLKIDVRTVQKIISYLKQTFIIKEIANSKQSKGKAAQNNKKYYLTDHTFYLFVKQSPFSKLDSSYQNKIFENILINEVRKVFDRYEVEVRFEIIDEIDVDLVIIKNDQKQYFEIKNSSSENSLSLNQTKIKNLKIIYRGKTKTIQDKHYINYLEFIKEVKKWI